MKDTEDTHATADRRTAARALLRTPLLTADGSHADELLLVRRHREELERLFAEGLGYRLLVEPKAARLFKAGLGRDAGRPLRKRLARGQGRPFEPRAYALLCLVLAALTRCSNQLLVDELVAEVRSAVADTDLVVDLDTPGDRRALAASLLMLLDVGVLVERDGDLARWADGAEAATSLLDVRRDRLRLLLAASLSGATSPADLLETAALPSAAGGARVAVRRRLLEQPVMSTADLTPDQVEWWGRNRHREAEWFRDRFGLELELRAEGAIAVDPDDDLSDVTFPGTGSARHAALLLLEHLVRDARDASGANDTERTDVTAAQVDIALAKVVADHGRGLRKAYADPDVLRGDVLEILGQVALLVTTGEGFRLHPAAARYAPQTTYAEGLF